MYIGSDEVCCPIRMSSAVVKFNVIISNAFEHTQLATDPTVQGQWALALMGLLSKTD